MCVAHVFPSPILTPQQALTLKRKLLRHNFSPRARLIGINSNTANCQAGTGSANGPLLLANASSCTCNTGSHATGAHSLAVGSYWLILISADAYHGLSEAGIWPRTHALYSQEPCDLCSIGKCERIAEANEGIACNSGKKSDLSIVGL